MKIIFQHDTLKRLHQELRMAQKLNNLRLYKMVWGLLLIHQKEDIKEVAQFLNISLKSLYNWITAFLVEGFSWLISHHYQGRGRKSRLNHSQKKKLFEIVEKGPENYGFDCGIWNASMILEVIQKEFKVTYNPRYLCELLRQIGLSFQKAKFEIDRLENEEHRKAREKWENRTFPSIIEEAKKVNGVILFGDEVSFAQWGSLARTWAPRGKQPKIKTCGKRKALKMFGAIALFHGEFVNMQCEGKFNGESYLLFLKKILEEFSKPVFLIEDGAPYHKSGVVKNFTDSMKALSRLFVHRLPPYSPDKNPIEKLWKNTKRDATHLKYFPTFDKLREAVLKAFKKYLDDASKVLCVMKKLRIQFGLA